MTVSAIACGEMATETDKGMASSPSTYEISSLQQARRDRKGFLNLPGELRNQIYEYLTTPGPVFPQNFAMSSTSRQIRAEFAPLYFHRATVQVKIQHVQNFLETFCPVNTAIQIEIPSQIPMLKRNIDLQWLICYLLNHPNVHISFQNSDFLPERAKDLNQLFEIAKSTPGWRKSLPLFEAIRVVIADPNPWQGGLWHVHMLLKTEHSPEYLKKNEVGLKRTIALLQR